MFLQKCHISAASVVFFIFIITTFKYIYHLLSVKTLWLFHFLYKRIILACTESVHRQTSSEHAARHHFEVINLTVGIGELLKPAILLLFLHGDNSGQYNFFIYYHRLVIMGFYLLLDTSKESLAWQNCYYFFQHLKADWVLPIIFFFTKILFLMLRDLM